MRQPNREGDPEPAVARPRRRAAPRRVGRRSPAACAPARDDDLFGMTLEVSSSQPWATDAAFRGGSTTSSRRAARTIGLDPSLLYGMTLASRTTTSLAAWCRGPAAARGERTGSSRSRRSPGPRRTRSSRASRTLRSPRAPAREDRGQHARGSALGRPGVLGAALGPRRPRRLQRRAAEPHLVTGPGSARRRPRTIGLSAARPGRSCGRRAGAGARNDVRSAAPVDGRAACWHERPHSLTAGGSRMFTRSISPPSRSSPLPPAAAGRPRHRPPPAGQRPPPSVRRARRSGRFPDAAHLRRPRRGHRGRPRGGARARRRAAGPVD